MLDFIGIGARRAGEDWLYEQLRRHPEIHFPREMELSFWSRHYPQSLVDADYSRDLEWYRSVFAHWPDGVSPTVRETARPAVPPQHHRSWFDKLMARLDGLDTRSQGAKLAELDPHAPPPTAEIVQAASKLGDFSPTYCWFDDTSMPAVIHDFAPQAKIIYIIRDPRNRAWAAAEKLRELAGLTPEETSDHWYADHFRSAQSLKQGDYARAIAQWQAAYENKLHIMQFEHISSDPHWLLQGVCAHIGVQDSEYFSAEPVAQLLKHIPAQTPMRPSLMPILDEIYAKKTQALYDISGIDYRRTSPIE
ncbi:MAG: sulfotransferase [Alphaproteobacteria bacterium]|nr:sulfotransferase [Alphaproteobacteria bacterium]